MLSGTKTKRAVMAILVAGAVGATGATSASAATVTKTDDTAADFALGTQDDTVVRERLRRRGVEIAPARSRSSSTGTRARGWTCDAVVRLAAGTPDGDATLAGGTHDRRRHAGERGHRSAARPGQLGHVPRHLGSRAVNRHVGFCADFNEQPGRSSAPGTDPHCRPGSTRARRTARGPLDEAVTPVTPVTVGFHNYRIDWTAGGFVFFIDDVQVASQTVALDGADADRRKRLRGRGRRCAGRQRHTAHADRGTFTSRAFDAGTRGVTAASMTAPATAPARHHLSRPSPPTPRPASPARPGRRSAPAAP